MVGKINGLECGKRKHPFTLAILKCVFEIFELLILPFQADPKRAKRGEKTQGQIAAQNRTSTPFV